MALLIRQKTFLNDITIIAIYENIHNLPLKIEKVNDFIFQFIENKLVGINILNSSKYFKDFYGVKTLTKFYFDKLKIKEFSFEDINKGGFIVGEVIERKVHPKSEKLFVLQVKTNKQIQIVTNTLNSLVGKKVVVALPNTFLPTGHFITKSKIMNVESNGMLCGAKTLLKIEDDSKGAFIPIEQVGTFIEIK